MKQWPTLQSLQHSRRRQILRFYERHPRPGVDLEQQLIEFEQAQPLTQDPALLEYGALMVQALIPQLRALIDGIAEFDRKTAAVFRKHPDRLIFESFLGAGAILAPRLSAAFGADRDRFQEATEVQEFSGIAPVTEQSGKNDGSTGGGHVRNLCAKRFMNLQSIRGAGVRGPKPTTSYKSSVGRLRRERFVLWRTNGFEFCFDAGRIGCRIAMRSIRNP